MSLERGQGNGPLVRGLSGEDAVVVVRRALARAEDGHPLFLGEDVGTEAALAVLEDRVRRVKAMGGEFTDIEVSVYARQLRSGSGRVPMVS